MNNPPEAGSPIRVLVQQNLIAHYRIRIFELLSQCLEMQFTIAADRKSDVPYLKAHNEFDERPIRHLQCGTMQIKIPGLPAFSLQPRVLAVLWKERPDVVIVSGTPYSLTAWFCGIAGRFLGIPVIMWTHGLLANESGPKWWIRKALYRLAAAMLLYGENAKKLLAAKGFDTTRLHVVFNSLDYDHQIEINAKIADADRETWRLTLGAGPNDGLIVFTGRLLPVKRLDLLIQSVAQLASRGKKVHLALIGEGSEKSSLILLSIEHGVRDLVHFLGEHYDEAYLGLALSSSDLAVVPSGAGLSVIHAMSYGTPVLIHDRTDFHFPESEAVINGKTGLCYKYNNVEDMARKIEMAIFPVPLKTGMAECCRNTIRSYYNPHRQLEIFLFAVRQVLAAGR